jgi:hypothetical protein
MNLFDLLTYLLELLKLNPGERREVQRRLAERRTQSARRRAAELTGQHWIWQGSSG